MPERFEVEPIPASETRKGDELILAGAPETIRSVLNRVDMVDLDDGPEVRIRICLNGHRPTFAPEDSCLRVVAARGGTEDELREPTLAMISGPALANGECVRVRLVDVPEAGRAASTGDDTA